MIVPSPRTLIEEVLFSLQYRLKPYFSVLVIVGLIFLLLRKFFFVSRVGLGWVGLGLGSGFRVRVRIRVRVIG